MRVLDRPDSSQVDTTIQLIVGRDVDVRFLVNPAYPDSVTLAIGTTTAEITFHPAMVEALRDNAEDALRRLRAERVTEEADDQR